MEDKGSDLRGARIGQIAVTVHDLDRAVAFYGDVLGMPFLLQVPKMAFFQCGDLRLMLAIPEKPEFDHPSSVLYYKVEDIEGTHRTLAARGIPFESTPHLVAKLQDHDLWMAFFPDSEGNVMALMSEVAR